MTPRQPLVSAWVSGLAVFGVGLLLAAGAARWEEQHNLEVASQRFDEVAQRVTANIAGTMRTYEKGLRGLRGAVVVNGGDALTRSQMLAYSATRDIDAEFPGARGFGVIWRVPVAAEADFVARARADGWPDFSIRQLQPHDNERFVIGLIEPVERNRPALGLDIGSEASRRRAVVTAMRSGSATLSGPLRLVQAEGQSSHGFVVALPIYRPGLPIATVAEREAAATGWTYAPLVIQEVLAGIGQDGALYTLTLRDLDTVDGGVFYDTTSTTAPVPGGPVRSVPIQLFGRQWDAQLQSTPAFLDSLDQRDPRGVGVALSVMAALAGGLVGLLGQTLQRKQRVQLEVARRAAIVDSSEEAIIAGTLEGVITEWNAGAERLFGLSARDALGRPAASLLLPPERFQEDADIRAIIARGERVLPMFTTRCHADGSLIDVSLTASPVFDSAGKCIGFAKIMRDIREARRAQLALADLNAQLEQQVADRTAKLDAARHTLQAILDAMPSQIGYWDRDLRNQVANRAYRDWFGVDPEGLRGRHMRELLGPQIFASSEAQLAAALAGQAQTFQGDPIPRPDGQGVRHGLVNYLPDIVDGEVRGIFTLVHDVTELTEGRLALAVAQRAQAALLQTLDRHSIVSVADRSGLIMSVNPAFSRISGYSESELVGQNHRIVNSGHHERDFWRTMWRTLAAGESWRGEVCNRAKDGSLYWVDSVVAPFFDADGRIEKYVSIRTDITPIKRLQQEAEAARVHAERSEERLQQAVHDARRANESKSRFLANMSHEIRTPMNAVIGLAYVLERTPLDGEQAQTVQKIRLAGQTLLAIINDVLDLSKFEAGEMRLERAPFDLDKLLREVVLLLSVQADARGIALTLERAPRVPDNVEGDATRLRQVLTNLLSNAIKFTEHGSVRLHVETRALPSTPDTAADDVAQGAVAGEAPEGSVALRFTVTDTGIGIAPDSLERLFNPFVQADSSTTRRFGGTGLGLSIVKQLVELMGGQVGVHSTPGKGSSFWVDLVLPLADTSGWQTLGEEIAPAGAQLRGLRVLVVDDNPMNLEVARRILTLEQAQVQLATNGLEAVNLLLADPGAFDAVLMDVQMPVLDGLDATRRIRSALGLTRLPIIGLTAGVSSTESRRARSAGMNEVLGKPIDPLELLRCIRRHAGDGDAADGEDAHGVQDAGAYVERGALRFPDPPAGWPRVDGIDAAECAYRLRGDEALFRRMLRQTLEDFADLAVAPGSGNAAPRNDERASDSNVQPPDERPGRATPAAAGLAARLHQLKGSAATLGAGALAVASARAETAARATGKVPADLMHSLAQALHALTQASTAWLATPDAPLASAGEASAGDASTAPGAPAADPAALATLKQQLQQCDLAAMDGFAELAPYLRQRLGDGAFGTLRGRVEQLDFAAALQVLEEVEP